MPSETLQISMEMWFAAFSLIAAACLMVGREVRTTSCRYLIALQLANALFMSSESLAWLFDGADGTIGRYVVVITNAMSFFAEYGMLALIAFYIRAKINESTKKKMKHTWRIFLLILATAAEASLMISQFTGWFYKIDESNTYVRGEYFYLAQGIGLMMFIVLLGVLFWYRKTLSRLTVMAIAVFVLSPLVAMLYQYFHYGFSFIGVATTMSVLFLFISYEMDVSQRMDDLNKKRLEELEYKY